MARPWAVGCLSLAGLLGCSNSTTPRTAPNSAPTTVQRSSENDPAEQAIAAFSVDASALDASFQTVNRLSAPDGTALRSAAMAHLGSDDPGVRDGAVYALMLTAVAGPSMNALDAVLQTGTDSERLLAATRLASLGQKDAMPIIIGFLGSDESLAYWEPATKLWQFATLQLLTLTDQDFGLGVARDRAAASATATAWTRWWTDNGATYTLHTQGLHLP